MLHIAEGASLLSGGSAAAFNTSELSTVGNSGLSFRPLSVPSISVLPFLGDFLEQLNAVIRLRASVQSVEGDRWLSFKRFAYLYIFLVLSEAGSLN